MNRKQRMQNRATAQKNHVYEPCLECGIREPHWVGVPRNLEQAMTGLPPDGFWTCPKFYGPDGRRLCL